MGDEDERFDHAPVISGLQNRLSLNVELRQHTGNFLGEQLFNLDLALTHPLLETVLQKRFQRRAVLFDPVREKVIAENFLRFIYFITSKSQNADPRYSER